MCKKCATNVSFIPFFIFGFWSLLATKLQKYHVIFVNILQGKMGKTEKNGKKITQSNQNCKNQTTKIWDERNIKWGHSRTRFWSLWCNGRSWVFLWNCHRISLQNISKAWKLYRNWLLKSNIILQKNSKGKEMVHLLVLDFSGPKKLVYFSGPFSL